MTMDFRNEADEIRALGEDHGQGLRLSRPEAGQLVLRLRLGAGRSRSRVRGQGRPRRSTSRFRLRDASAPNSRPRSAWRQLPDKRVYAVIWTTTPWTIPANQALNVHPDFDYALVDTERGLLVLASDRERVSASRRYQLE